MKSTMAKKQPRREVEDGYIFVNIFVENNMTLGTIMVIVQY